ncbi:MAG TPA: TolC family protein [Pyrinomonadaceae bacterium]|nr:TolC family protein [Pyrinomonadaceae bacterium]
MQRTISLSTFFLIIALTVSSVHAQTNDEQPIQRERVGVETADAIQLTLNEAIRLALENNNDIRTSRIDVEKAEYRLTASRGAYDPKIFSETYFEHSSTPVASFLGGNSSGSLKQKDFTSRAGLSGLAPKFGGSYQFDVSSTHLSSNNFFNALDPAISSRFSFSYTQPLVRGLKTDDTRRKIEIAKKNLTLTDVQFRQRATDVITRVEKAYWELVHALKSLQVQTEAVKQTRAQVETNKKQVAQGVLAPIDVVEAEAQVKIYEQNVYAAQEEVTRMENALKTLMLASRSSEVWSRALLPVTPVNLEAPRMLLSDAIQTALENRFELAELRTSKDINEINKRFYRDQTKPQVDLVVNYSSNGYAGSLTDNDNPILNGLTSLDRRVSELSTLAGLPVLPPTTFNTIPADLQGGFGRSWSNLLGQDNPTVRVGVKISLPLKNRTAKAELGESLAEGRRIDTVRAQAEQLIEAEVRNAIQKVRSVEASMSAAEAARVAAEQQYVSEQRKFQGGMSTVFLVLQRQTDLVMARGRELETQTDLNKAIAEFQRATGNTFRYRNVAVISEGLQLANDKAADR